MAGYIPESALKKEQRSLKQMDVSAEFIETLEPHIRTFVELTYNDADTLIERAAGNRKTNQQMLDGLESEKMRAEIAELQGEEKELFEGILQSAKRAAGQTDEEFVKQAAEIDEDLIEEYSQKSSEDIWRMVVRTARRLFRESGPQCLDVGEFLSKLDFAKYLADKILEKHYPEMKAVLAALMPRLLKDSFMDTAGKGKYMEVAYLESSGQIVLREVNWEMVQTWANS